MCEQGHVLVYKGHIVPMADRIGKIKARADKCKRGEKNREFPEREEEYLFFPHQSFNTYSMSSD
jgi:hypothetical protein